MDTDVLGLTSVFQQETQLNDRPIDASLDLGFLGGYGAELLVRIMEDWWLSVLARMEFEEVWCLDELTLELKP